MDEQKNINPVTETDNENLDSNAETVDNYSDELDIFENSKGDSFVKLSDKYEDIKSSSYTMLFVGLVGIVLLTLVITEIIKLPIQNATSMPLFYIVLGCAFVMFVIGGFISLIHSKKVLVEAQAEDLLMKQIEDYSKVNISVSQLDEGLDLSEPTELLYFSRFERIKEKLMVNFETANEDLIDYMSENIYHDLYEKDEKEV